MLPRLALQRKDHQSKQKPSYPLHTSAHFPTGSGVNQTLVLGTSCGGGWKGGAGRRTPLMTIRPASPPSQGRRWFPDAAHSGADRHTTRGSLGKKAISISAAVVSLFNQVPRRSKCQLSTTLRPLKNYI